MLCTHHMCGGKNMYVGCMLLHIDTMYTMKAVIASCFDSLKKMSMRVISALTSRRIHHMHDEKNIYMSCSVLLCIDTMFDEEDVYVRSFDTDFWDRSTLTSRRIHPSTHQTMNTSIQNGPILLGDCASDEQWYTQVYVCVCVCVCICMCVHAFHVCARLCVHVWV